MTVTLTKLYEILSLKIGKQEAETLTTYIEEKISVDFADSKNNIVAEIKLEIEKSRTETERALRSQLWVIIALFLPLYVTITFALINLLKHP